MKAYYLLATDKVRGDGLAPVFIVVQEGKRLLKVATDISLEPGKWSRGKVVGTDKVSLRKSLELQRWWLDIQEITFEMRNRGVEAVRDAIVGRLFPERVASVRTLLSVFDEFVKSKAGRTREVYEATRTKVERYGDVGLAEITPGWLTAFEGSMDGLARNSRSIHLRNIRAVVNYAIDNDMTTNYPFRKFKIRHEATRKRALTVEQLRELFSMEVDDWQREYRDFFMLTFLLIGINAVDLCHIREVVNGRVEYRRSKTGRLYSVKVEPEAAAVAARLAGKDWWICPRDRYASQKEYLRHANRAMQRVGEVERVGRGGRKVITPRFPGITTYWMRHSWATIAAGLDIPKETIAAALGHGGNGVTDIYIDFDRRKVDEANRRVINYVFGGLEADASRTVAE